VVAEERGFDVPARRRASFTIPDFARGSRVFFRATWTPYSSATAPAQQTESVSSLRCAVIAPAAADLTDSPLASTTPILGFLVRLAREAGIVWCAIGPPNGKRGASEGQVRFHSCDLQIQRVLNQDSQVEVLLPFPSANWSTTARADEVDKAAGNDTYLRTRLPLSYPPADMNDFGAYAAAVARHYAQSQPWAVTHFQILNEPVYTDYALPRKFGYGLANYLRLLESAGRALHAADPQCRVVGGISANLADGLTRDFVAQGGLRWVDVFDLQHVRPAAPGWDL